MSAAIQPNPKISFTAAFADEHLLVVEKPAGVVTEPGKGHADDSLLNGLFAVHGRLLQALGAARDWGLLHRLDRDTSGLLLVALRPAAYDALRAAFEARQIRKRYLALVSGCPRTRQGTVQQPIQEVVGTQRRAVIKRQGKPAVTAYRVLATSADRGADARGGAAADGASAPARAAGRGAADVVSLIEARPATGRLHQIRVHLAHLDCPVLGDEMYGSGRPMPRVPRLCLHAAELSFVHPVTQRRMTVTSPWPDDLRGVLRRFGLTAPV